MRRLIVACATVLALSSASAAQERFHPAFIAYDADGRLVRDSGQPISAARSCAACHDTAFIGSHDLHARKGVKIDCLTCHVAAPGLPVERAAFDAQGRLLAERAALQAPADAQCLACHGGGGSAGALKLPARLLDPAPGTGLHPEHLTREQGTLFGAGPRRASQMNLQGKEGLDQPWDVHAARVVSCVDCHYAPNKPGRQGPPQASPAHLRMDPRRLSTAEFLKRPDHRLASAECEQCHDPGKGHAFLPYAQRHFEQLDCRSCHVPVVHAPVLMQEDRALPDVLGRPQRQWRNLEGTDDDPLNARLVRPFEPAIASVVGVDGRSVLRPINIVTERAWHDVEDQEIAYATVVRARATLGQGADLAAMRAALQAAGIPDPVARTRSRVIPIAHGVQEGRTVLRTCLDCHRAGGRLDTPLALGSLADPSDPALPRWGNANHLYLPGLGRQTWTTRLGAGTFLLTVLGVFAHAVWRWRTQRLRAHVTHPSTRRVYLYSAYERFWHWTMAASTLGLVVTGLEIHFTARITIFGFSPAVSLHNALAFVLLGNAALSLFYHVTTGGIGQFIPRDTDLRGALVAQARYYLQGIFVGAAHPVPKTVGRKMNPLQQLTYLALLNVLLPLQIVSGILIWGAERWPAYSAALGGLAVITPLHNLGSWLFMSFTLGHVYLTTTGHTLTSNLAAMVGGWDEVETDVAADAATVARKEDEHGVA